MSDWSEIFTYSDGNLFWKVTKGPKVKAGQQAGCKRSDGYKVVRYQNTLYLQHRIIYEICVGEIPDGWVIDHIDENPSNNRVENLRAVPKMQNSWRLPAKGYYKNKQGKFVGQIRAANKEHYLGAFDSKEEAREAYLKAKAQKHKILEGT